MFLTVLILVMALVFLGFYFITDNLITRKKVKRNQMLWDEYSKHMTYDEKWDCFLEWLELNKLKHGDEFYYIPRM